jgi:hypothetical protein
MALGEISVLMGFIDQRGRALLQEIVLHAASAQRLT